MAYNNFRKCLDMVLRYEGGFVNHPEDPGGATNMGITKNTLENYLGRNVSINEVKNIDMDTVANIYKQGYWDIVMGDDLPYMIDLIVFDFGVLAGPNRSVRFLQEIVDSYADGVMGPNTLRALDEYISNYGVYSFITTFKDKKSRHFESLSHYNTFGRGWENRNNHITGYALDKITGEQ